MASWNASNLTICGVGGRARLYADGKHAQGKGIWVVGGSASSTMTIYNVEFHDAKVPDENGAGIRWEGGNLVLSNTGFYDNENGILGGDSPFTLTIDNSEFARNGFGDGFTHNLYVGNANRLTVRASYFHEAKIGHNLKSRARENFIENSYFMDGTTGNSSYLLDFPDGGVVFMRGNLLQKGPNADNNISVAYGMERNTYATNTVTLIHNTLASTMSGGTFVGVAGYTQSLTLTANLFAGSAAVSSGVTAPKLVQQNNVTTSVGNIPGVDTIAAPNFWPNATVQSQIVLAGVVDAQYLSDSPQPYVLRSLSAISGRKVGALQAVP